MSTQEVNESNTPSTPEPETIVHPEVSNNPKTLYLNRGKIVIFFIAILLVSITDQVTKHWAQGTLQFLPRGQKVLVDGYLSFTYVRNPGAAWGLLSKAKESFRKPFFFITSVIASIFILFLLLKSPPSEKLTHISLSTIFGGAIGNFIDRFRYEYVVDFIDVHYLNKFRWPTFNVADIAITVGVIFMLLEILKSSSAKKTVD